MPGELPQYVRTSSPPQLLHLPPAAALAPRGAAEPPDLDIWRKDGREECRKRGNGQGYATHCTSGLCNSNGADITRNGAHSVEADRYAPSTVPGFGNEKAKEIEVQSAKQSRNEEEFEVGKTSYKQACSSIDQGAKKKADPAARDDGYPMVEASTSTEELELPHLGVKGTWGSFLPQRPLRVLLVEDDNATRHVVTALLRKCGYEVSTAANGLQAWELMSSSRDIFDVVLTDVIMPVLSGTGLLDKIMRSEAHRDTPVIMMSSHDSLDMVFKCLLKGAKDFLVKPVRKNELRNLWQHVWRKCRNSSRCQSGNRSKSAKLKRAEKHSSSGIDTSSGKDKIDSCRDKKDGGDSDNGSATQGTWMERPNEVASTPQMTVGNLSSTPVGDNNSVPQMHPQVQVKVENLNKHGGESIQVEHPMEHTGIDDTLVNSEGSLSSERSAKAIDLIGTIGRHSIHDQDNESDGGKDELAPRMVEGVRPKTSQTLWLESSPLHRLELTLKRPYSSEDARCKGDGRRVLRQSGCSAFSRYSGSGTMYERQQNAIYASLPSDKCSLVDGPRGHSASSRGGLGCGNSATSHGMPGPGGRDANSSTFMASQGDDSLQTTHVSSNNSALISVSPQKMISYGSGQTVGYNLQVYSPYYPISVPQWSARQSYTAEREMYDNRDHNQDYCSEHHYFNEHARACDSQEAPSPRCDQDVISEIETGFPQSTSDITEIFPNEKVSEVGSTQNGFFSNRMTSLNVTGSNEGSSTHYSNVDGNNMNPISTGDCSLGDAANTDGNSAMTYGGISIVDGGNANGIMGMPDQTRAAQREAALNKFRQKRKVRCFEKKVRYQSRKKLAEQRPRVKGQFVRQAVYEAIVQEPNK